MLLCPWESAQYLFFSSNIPTLFFYSHIPAIVVALVVSILVFYKSDKSKVGGTLLVISLLFSAWSIFDLILWATNRPDIVMFFWSLQILVEPLIYILAFYLTYLFVRNTDLSFRGKITLAVVYIPIVLLLYSKYNLSGVYLPDCTAIEGFIAQYFTYIIEIILAISVFLFTDREYKKNIDPNRKKEVLTFGLGVITFLLAFSWGNLIGSFTENWTLAQAGLIGMPVFIAFLAYLIVRFHTFHVNLFAAQVLIAGLWVLVFGILFIRHIENVRVVTIFTLVLVSIVGYLLIRSVRKEIQRKEELQKLNIELENLVKQRESLMHLINHKVKSSFTHSKYIFAGILEGTFGNASEEMRKRAAQGLEANDGGIKTVDLVLNAANLQRGLIKYEMKSCDLKNVIATTIGEKKIEAEKRELALESVIKDGDYNIVGDSFWLKEVISNLIENSIKYTKEGKISILLETVGKDKIKFTIKDTGIGITPEDKQHLFTEGGRGKESVKINVDSTGYGLYSVKLIIEAHGGRVWADSGGLNKGSTFFVELPRNK